MIDTMLNTMRDAAAMKRKSSSCKTHRPSQGCFDNEIQGPAVQQVNSAREHALTLACGLMALL